MDPQTQAYVNALSGPNPKAGPSYWPDQSDLDWSKKYDTLYGSPWAPEATPGHAVVTKAPMVNGGAWHKNTSLSLPAGSIDSTNTQADADRARAQAIAAERSAVAKLGFNPSKQISSEGNAYTNYNGLFKRDPFGTFGGGLPRDFSWYREDTPSAAMHESMHRAIDMLATTGKLPKSINRKEEELYVRALMNRAYGDIEVQNDLSRGGKPNPEMPGFQQVLKGKELAKSPVIDELEAAAAAEVAKRHPRGPR